jgi:membrane protein DedA with SNARE-associated domain
MTMNRVRRLRGVLLVAVGLVTPLGVLAVNASAFVMQHLTEFQLTITFCALVSALLLNSLTAYWALRYAERSATPLFTEYRTWIISLAVVAVLVSAALSTYLTYVGLRDPRHLPDKFAVLGSLGALVLPFVFTYLQRRMARRSRARRRGEKGTAELTGQGPVASGRSPRPGIDSAVIGRPRRHDQP